MSQTKLARCFAEALGIQEQAVTDELAYQTIKEWDSVRHMALVAIIEQTFNVMLDTNDIIAMSSVEKAKAILAKYGIDCDAA